MVRERRWGGEEGFLGQGARRQVEEEGRRLVRRVRRVGHRLEEEDIVREEGRNRRSQQQRGTERKDEERRREELVRVERNREWRERREEERGSKEERGEEGRKKPERREDAGSLEAALRRELVCQRCGAELGGGEVWQCEEGHLACVACRRRGEVRLTVFSIFFL